VLQVFSGSCFFLEVAGGAWYNKRKAFFGGKLNGRRPRLIPRILSQPAFFAVLAVARVLPRFVK
jgi:hypothetical protein